MHDHMAEVREPPFWSEVNLMSIETLAEQICRFCAARACLKVAHGAHRSAVGPAGVRRPGQPPIAFLRLASSSGDTSSS